MMTNIFSIKNLIDDVKDQVMENKQPRRTYYDQTEDALYGPFTLEES